MLLCVLQALYLRRGAHDHLCVYVRFVAAYLLSYLQVVFTNTFNCYNTTYSIDLFLVEGWSKNEFNCLSCPIWSIEMI